METQLPNNVVGLASMFSVIILGIFALISLVDKSLSNRRKLISDVDKELITTLQEQVKVLKEKAEGAETRSLNTQMDFEKLKSENLTLREILQGRDQATLEFQKSGKTVRTNYPAYRENLPAGVIEHAEYRKTL